MDINTLLDRLTSLEKLQVFTNAYMEKRNARKQTKADERALKRIRKSL